MKRRFLAASFAIILSLAIIGFSGSPAGAVQTFEKVSFINGVVTANELNLRSGPSMDNEIIDVLKRHKWVNVLAKIGEWYVVFDPVTGKVGCVAKPYLVDAATVSQTPTAGQSPSTTVKPPAATPAPSAQPQQTGDLSQDEKALLDLINKERSASNIAPLQADAELMKVARIKAADMTKNNYFSHYSPTYGSPFDMMRQFGINFKAAAENIAGNSTVQGAVTSWMKSEGHRNNIMNSSYNYTGIGISKSSKYGNVFVQMFIKN